jgi:hypothetical protein
MQGSSPHSMIFTGNHTGEFDLFKKTQPASRKKNSTCITRKNSTCITQKKDLTWCKSGHATVEISTQRNPRTQLTGIHAFV